MHKILRILIVSLVLLTACSPKNNASAPTIPTVTSLPKATSTTAPTKTPAPTATSKPTATPALTTAQNDELQRIYKVLVFTQLYESILVESVNVEDPNATADFTTSLILGIFGNAINEAYQGGIEMMPLKACWSAMGAQATSITNLAGSWVSGDITANTVTTRLPGIQKSIETELKKCEAVYESRYGYSAEKMKSVRDKAIEEGRKALQNSGTSSVTVEESSDIRIVSSRDFTSNDYMYIVGEVENTSSQPQEYVKVVATFYDDSNTVIGTESSYTSLDVIPAGGKMPFKIMSSTIDAASYKLQVQGRAADTLPQGLTVQSYQTYLTQDYYYVIGEVKNTSSQPQSYVKIAATLYDSDGKVVQTDTSYTMVDVIMAGGSAPFKIMVDHSEGTQSVALVVSGREDTIGRTDLVITSQSENQSGSYLTIVGEVKNEGNQPAEFVKVIATLYDESGNVVGVESGYTSLDTISAGGSSPFQLMVDHFEGYASYTLQVQGR